MQYELPGVLNITVPEQNGAPLILDSPHSGTIYPNDFKPLISQHSLRKVEDSFVDALFGEAPSAGATLLCAQFPRSYIDPNRAVSDIDPAMILGTWPGPLRPTEKSRLGHGLIWKTYPPDRPLYSGRLPVNAIQRRINDYWIPYHETLETEMRRLYITHGGVWHLNCHSMPSTSSPFITGRGGLRADFVLGDRDGTSCEPEFTDFVYQTLSGMGYAVRLNDPYRGAELVRAYADPLQGRHSLQIEINRAIYMDEKLITPGQGFDALQQTLTNLVTRMADYTRSRSGTIAEAAE